MRQPRILTALFAGTGLALCGAALQGVFRNPLVGPHIIGVSTGAAFGGTLAILISESRGLLLMLTFLCGMLALLMVYALNALVARRNMLVLVLAGVVVSGLFSARHHWSRRQFAISKGMASERSWTLERLGAYRDQFAKDVGQYEGIIQRRGMNRDDVLPSFGDFAPWEAPPKTPKPGAGAGSPAPVRPGSKPVPPQAARALWDDPSQAEEFDAYYGPGISSRILGR